MAGANEKMQLLPVVLSAPGIAGKICCAALTCAGLAVSMCLTLACVMRLVTRLGGLRPCMTWQQRCKCNPLVLTSYDSRLQDGALNWLVVAVQ